MKTLLLILILAFPFMLNAQAGARVQQKKENIEAQKVAYITKKIGLTADEAQKFWPVYNQAQKEKQEVRKLRRETTKDKKRIDEMTDAEVQKAMDAIFVAKQKELDIDKTYHAKYLTILPAKKVGKLYQAEEEFKRILLERLKESKSGGGGNDLDD
jgi:tRNA U34 5-carboxymethylaminomethyl modifying enzyme MnmG/GidA